MVTDVFFDESGYTGRALLDPVQPHLVVASSIIGETDAEAILREAFPSYQGEEFKFQNIWKRPNSRVRLPEFARIVGSRAQDLFFWHIDKRFCVLTKLVDHLLEPLAYERGFDFYQDAYAHRFSNYIYVGLKHIGAPGLYEAVTDAYYAFAIDPTEERLASLRRSLTLMANSTPDELEFFFGSALEGVRTFHEHSDIATFRDTLETQVTSILASVSYWTHKRPGPLNVRHDQSASFFKDGSLWKAIASPKAPAHLHPTANGPPTTFPLPVVSTTPVDSKTSYAIQLCDLAAGLTAKMLARDPDNQAIVDAVLATPFAHAPKNGISPGDEFPDGPPARRAGPDAVDQMVSIIRTARGE